MQPIGFLKSCFKEKFGTPRQPGLVTSARSELIFQPPFRQREAFRGLEDYSHIWLIFLFHKTESHGWKPTVRPPRLGGNERKGVFATRSPFRPNPIGLSVVKLEKIDYCHPEGPVLILTGADLVDGSPILDIKPYLPYADSMPEATGGFAPDKPEPVKVNFPDGVGNGVNPYWIDIIRETLATDPRPAYHHNPEREYGMELGPYNIRWVFRDGMVTLRSISITDHNTF